MKYFSVKELLRVAGYFRSRSCASMVFFLSVVFLVRLNAYESKSRTQQLRNQYRKNISSSGQRPSTRVPSGARTVRGGAPTGGRFSAPARTIDFGAYRVSRVGSGAAIPTRRSDSVQPVQQTRRGSVLAVRQAGRGTSGSVSDTAALQEIASDSAPKDVLVPTSQPELKPEPAKVPLVADWFAPFTALDLKMAVSQLKKNKVIMGNAYSLDDFSLAIAPERYDALMNAQLPADFFGEATMLTFLDVHKKINEFLNAPARALANAPTGALGGPIVFEGVNPKLTSLDGKTQLVTKFDYYNDYDKQLALVEPVAGKKRADLFYTLLLRLGAPDQQQVKLLLSALKTVLAEKKSTLALLAIPVSSTLKSMTLMQLITFLGQQTEAKIATGSTWGAVLSSYFDEQGEKRFALEAAYRELISWFRGNMNISVDENSSLWGTFGEENDYSFVEMLEL